MFSMRYNLRKRNVTRPGKDTGKSTPTSLKKSLPTKNGCTRRIRQGNSERKRRLLMSVPSILETSSPHVNAVKKLKRISARRKSSPPVVRVSSYLTSEILESIFEYLLLEDRKNARLVCKLWYQNCTRTVVTKKEKLVFRAHCSLSDMINVLLKSSFGCMNLEFHNILINYLPTEVWKVVGHKVYEINVYPTSRLQDDTLKDIILYCENLTRIKMWKSWERDTSSELLNYFVNECIKRTRLHTFATFYNPPHNSISSDIIRNIFLIFPRIKHFCVKNYVGTETETWYDSIILHSPTQLESLTYGTLSNDCWQKEPVIPVWGTRLTKIEMMLTRLENAPQILNFFSVQKELKKIILKIKFVRGQEFAKKLMFHILENCPNLREFRFIYAQTIRLTSEESSRFFALISKLECLSASCDMGVETSTLPCRNLALKVLSLSWIHEHSLSYILKHSTHLRHLQLDLVISDTILLEIFRYVTNLQTLILTRIDDCTTDGFTGQYPMRHLRMLEHLEMRAILKPAETFDIVQVASEFQFLPLKHLRLCIDLSPDDLLCITSNTPALESLRFDYPYLGRIDNLSLEKTIEFCSCLKKLKYLHVRLHLKGRNLRHKTYLKSLFKACSSLRYFRVDRDFPSMTFGLKRVHSRKVYSFDPFTNEVLLNRSKHSFHYPGSRRSIILRNV